MQAIKGENGGNRSMIYTVTSIHPLTILSVWTKSKSVVSIIMDSDDKFAGGKGINVSRVLKRLDIPNTATGFIGIYW